MSAVYVDQLFTGFARDPQAIRVGHRNFNQWCHMWSEDEQKLHAMAESIGLRRSWFQDRPGFPHYDLTPSKRILAVKAGAKEMDLRKWLTCRGSFGWRAASKPPKVHRQLDLEYSGVDHKRVMPLVSVRGQCPESSTENARR